MPIDNNFDEQQIRPWATGRKNWLFAGTLLAGQRAAAIMSLIQTAKPSDLLSLIDLTEHFHYHQVDLQRAADAVERALAVAIDQGLLVRQVLGVRMRIALETSNFELARDSLLRLVEYQPKGQSLDVAYESDFVEKIPPGSIDAALIGRYTALLPAD